MSENSRKYYNNAKKKHFNEQVKEITEAMDKDINEELAEMDLEELVDGDETAKLREELEASKALCADYLEKLARNMAEFDNFRKRTLREKAAMFDDGAAVVIDKILPIMDNFELAVNSARNRGEDNFFKGVEMILRQFKLACFDLGVEEIPALGAQFDPGFHNAVSHVSDDAFGPNEIIEEMRKGYKYKDRVIRHSMVKVAN